nr:MAG TPA: hypothetical protein [Caudoviricetes sp.]
MPTQQEKIKKNTKGYMEKQLLCPPLRDEFTKFGDKFEKNRPQQSQRDVLLQTHNARRADLLRGVQGAQRNPMYGRAL